MSDEGLRDELTEFIHGVIGGETCGHGRDGDRWECEGYGGQLAAFIEAREATAWTRGYMACSDDFEVHLNHTSGPYTDTSWDECDCSDDPLAANPYKTPEEDTK